MIQDINKNLLFAAILANSFAWSPSFASKSALDQEFEFKSGGTGVTCLGSGWHASEPGHTWSAGPYVALELKPYEGYLFRSPSLCLIFKTVGTYPDTSKWVTVTFQGVQLEPVKIEGGKSFTLDLPNFKQGIHCPEATLLSFKIPN